MIKEIFCDLDGTLYNEKVSEKDIAAIRSAQDAGIRFNIATGRVFSHTKDIVSQTNVDGDMICENGSYIYNNDGQCLYKASLSDDSIKKVIKAYNKLSYITDDEVLYFKYDGEVVIPTQCPLEGYFSKGFRVDEEILCKSTYDSKVGNMGVFSPSHEMLERIVKDLNEIFTNDFDIYISGSVTLNIVPKGVSKFEAIKMICKKRGVGLDEVVTIGDSPNDIVMLKNIKMSFAMETAKDEVKSSAAYLTPTVADAVKMIIDYNQMNM